MSNDFLYTRKVIAERLGVSVPTLMRYVAEDNCPVVKDKSGTHWTTSNMLEQWYEDLIKTELKKKKVRPFDR